MREIPTILNKTCIGCGADKLRKCLDDGTVCDGLTMSKWDDGVTIYYYRCTACECAYILSIPDGMDDVQQGTWGTLSRPKTRCGECNELISSLKENGLCVLCDRWNSFATMTNSERVVRVNGHHYYIEDEDRTSLFGMRGFGGQKFTIKFFDGRVVTTTNLWAQGEIAVHFRDRLSNNAIFIGEKPGDLY